MNVESILTELRAQLTRIDTAIAALERTTGNTTEKRRGRKPWRHMSAEARARISAGMKKRWAAAKKAGKSRLAS